ncbi:hypothetical protein Tco_0842935 [Tanacetum coccineum]|uniref:Uncharacterized protein n=1 Tax=Tanacetum coccineum TaxID=301880 RepID=A0ABQ5B3Y3_9ASTR
MESVKKSIDERALHKREYDKRVNERQIQTKEGKVDRSNALDASLVGTERQQHTQQPEFNNKGEEKIFAIAALRNELRKLKGTSVDTKFAKSSILGKPVFQSLRNQSVVRQPTVSRSAVVKPHHVIASSKSRNSSKNMSRFSSNDMVHNHYQEETRKKTQESGRNSRPSVMPSSRSQSTANGSIPKQSITKSLGIGLHLRVVA